MLRRISLLIAVTLLCFPSIAAAQDIEAGCDCWQTEPGTQVSLPELPEGFFGHKNGFPSDAIPPQVISVRGEPLPDSVILAHCPDALIIRITWYDAHGTPVSPDDRHRVSRRKQVVGVEPFDTIVCRPDPINFDGIGVPQPVPIELIELSLRSYAPIRVTFGDQPASLYDVTVTEDGEQYTGQMTLTPTQFDPDTLGTSRLDILPVGYVITFIDLGQVLPPREITGLHIEFVETDGQFGLGLVDVDIGDQLDNSKNTILYAAVPNPFTQTTLLKYHLSRPGKLEIDIYDATGRLVRHLVGTTAEAGYGAAEWDGRNDAGVRVGPGIYFARLLAGDEVSSQRMITLE